MQQQQPPPMMPMVPSFPSTNITTEQIQKYLDENKQLILAILDNQNLGRLAECAQYQAQLQKNLMYLAAIADAQPQAQPTPSQMHPHVAMQQGGQYMQHPQAAAQPSVFASKVPVQFNPQQMQEQQQQQQQQHQHQQHHAHQQSIPGHMIMMRPGTNNGMHAMHPEGTHGGSDFGRGGGVGGAPSGVDGRGGSKQDSGAASEAGSGDGHGSSAGGHGGGADAEPSYLKGAEEDAN